MKLLKVTKKDGYIYEILYEKGWLFKTYHTEYVFCYLGDLRFLKDGTEIDYKVGYAIKSIIPILKDTGDSYKVIAM